jgi:hypothetical protein
MTILTHKEQAFLWAVIPGGMSTHGTRLTGKVGVHFHGHALLQEGFIGNHTVQFCKCPRTLSGVGFAFIAVFIEQVYYFFNRI